MRIRFICQALICVGLPIWCSAAHAETVPGKPIEIFPAHIPNNGVLFVEHEKTGDSGHGNQAVTECVDGKVIAFFSNSSGKEWDGHSSSGWTAYKISTDSGKTWSQPHLLAYSKAVNNGGAPIHSALVEEAVTADNGTVIAFLGRYTDARWHRTTPAYIVSRDDGETWSDPREVDDSRGISQIGRTHAAFVHKGTVFALFDSGTHSTAKDGTGHKLYVSRDNGETFQWRSNLPFAETAWYGTMNVIQGNKIIAYVYREADERNIQYSISDDDGFTWSEVQTTLVSKSLRNPQLSGELGGYYFMHGRSGSRGADASNLVLYSSKDGINWDEGVFLNKGNPKDLDSYSTNEILGKYTPAARKSLLIQSSISYDQHARVNLRHWLVSVRPDIAGETK